MKRLALAVLVLTAQPALVLSAHMASAGETVRVLGGKLGPTEPEPVFTATRDHIVVFGLPKNWSAGAGSCHTAAPGQYKRLRFAFNDGNTSVAKLEAQGYALSAGADGSPATSLTICRDTAGKIQSIAAQIAMIGSSGSNLEFYVVNTTNTAPGQGSSFSEFAVFDGSHSATFTAYSGAPNRVRVSN